jgi:ribonuclease J
MQYLNKTIPIWLGKATHKLLEINNIFLSQQNHVNKTYFFEKSVPFTIGDFTITPYWNDHLAFDSYSFLLEAEGKRLFYSGDFRSHGRKSRAYRWFLSNKPSDIDYLLLEGTTIGRGSSKFQTEADIENELVELFKKSQSINYIYTSSQNLDRLVSIYRACVRSGKILVADIYTTYVLDMLSEFAGFPTPLKGYDSIQVLYPYWLTKRLFDNGHKDIAYLFTKHKISKDEINKNPSKYVLIVRPSMKTDLKMIDAENGNLVYSMWEGYKNQPQTKEFLDWLLDKNFTIHDIHTSGHADVDTLKEYVDAINPKAIIPIHTFNKSEYKNIFNQRVVELDDNMIFHV